ncbi:MAG: 4-hydroxy-tetrahydrodipicolinate synthase [Gammaproteobacteria bacterium]|nr:4-hydroxy-tetrahydrodipicolinate synthase [Gemmatimonadota bacterium]NIU79301.1 4-hydroxy-tetrahydrodipicolinate synthase [Gammaproteobacteria bacterium]
METGRFRGLGVALVTPFHEDGTPDLESFARHVEFQVGGGVDFLVPCGTTGESATLDDGEQRSVIETAVAAAAGRVPVVAGAGTNDTDHAARLARSARVAGADGVLSVSPYYNKPSPEGLFRHYEVVAGAAEIPLIVYNVPGRTGGNIDPATLFRIAEIDNVVGVKEASGDLEQIMTILQGRPDGFMVLSGDDALTLPIVAAGGDGVISVAANEAPDVMSALVSAALAGDMATARQAHYRLYPLMKANFIETNPVPVKTALQMMERMVARFRLPLAPMTEANADALEEAMLAAGLLE